MSKSANGDASALATPDFEAKAREFLKRQGMLGYCPSPPCGAPDCACAPRIADLAKLLAEVAGETWGATLRRAARLTDEWEGEGSGLGLLFHQMARLPPPPNLGGAPAMRAAGEAAVLVIDSGAPAPEGCDCEVCRMRRAEAEGSLK